MILPFSLFSFLAKEVADCWVGLVGIDMQVFFPCSLRKFK